MYLKKIQSIIYKRFGIEPEEIQPTSHFQEDLNLGELEFKEIISDLEEEYEIELEEYTADIETVEELVNVLSEELD